HMYLGERHEAERSAAEAMALLETLPPSRELAMTYAHMSGMCMLVSDTAQTRLWGERAIALAEHLGDMEIVCSALNSIGCTFLCEDNEAGWAMLERSLQLALAHGYEDHAARAYNNLASNMIDRWAYAQATSYLQDGLAYCAEHDLDT